MSTEENKRIAADFFGRFSASDVAGALAMMSEDATWRIPGRRELNPSAGEYDKERIGKLFYRMTGQLKGPLSFAVKGLVAEGDTVAIELEGRGELKNGRVYNNHYHLAMVIRDGKVWRVREYLDTQHVFAIWFQPEE